MLAAFAAGVALAGEPEAVIDASRYFVQAKHLELFGPSAFFRDWGGALPAWTDLPLPAFLYGPVFRLCGEHRLPQQVFTAGLFALTAFATARIGGLLWGARTGARGALLLLAIPCLLVQVPLLMADVPAMAAVTVALWALLETLERRGAGRVAAAALALAAALLAKYSTWVLLGAAFGIDPAARGAAGQVGGGRPGRRPPPPRARSPRRSSRSRSRSWSSGSWRCWPGFQWEGLRRWVESYPSTFLFQAHPLLAAAALAALWRGWRQRDRRVLVAAALPLVLFALGARRTRYLLPAFPMIALLAARGLEALPGRARRFAAARRGRVLAGHGLRRLPAVSAVGEHREPAGGRPLPRRARGRRGRGDGAAGAGRRDQPRGRGAAARLPHGGADRRALPAAPPPPPEELRASSFRFTWEQPLPSWYRAGAPAPPARHRS